MSEQSRWGLCPWGIKKQLWGSDKSKQEQVWKPGAPGVSVYCDFGHSGNAMSRQPVIPTRNFWPGRLEVHGKSLRMWCCLSLESCYAKDYPDLLVVLGGLWVYSKDLCGAKDWGKDWEYVSHLPTIILYLLVSIQWHLMSNMGQVSSLSYASFTILSDREWCTRNFCVRGGLL